MGDKEIIDECSSFAHTPLSLAVALTDEEEVSRLSSGDLIPATAADAAVSPTVALRSADDMAAELAESAGNEASSCFISFSKSVGSSSSEDEA
jgi:hypothetical protein